MANAVMITTVPHSSASKIFFCLVTKGVLKPISSHYNLYIIGIGFGTFLGNLLFIFGGRFIVDTLNTNQKYLHLIIGIIFLLTALIFLVKLIRKKDAISEIKTT